MMHKRRRWSVARRTAEEIADALHGHTWTACTAWQTPAGTIWANDSTGPDGIAEYGVFRLLGGAWIQVESITTDWCRHDGILEYLRRADAGEWDGNRPCGQADAACFEYEGHELCHHCA